jgi:hypothetical protein
MPAVTHVHARSVVVEISGVTVTIVHDEPLLTHNCCVPTASDTVGVIDQNPFTTIPDPIIELPVDKVRYTTTPLVAPVPKIRGD